MLVVSQTFLLQRGIRAMRQMNSGEKFNRLLTASEEVTVQKTLVARCWLCYFIVAGWNNMKQLFHVHLRYTFFCLSLE